MTVPCISIFNPGVRLILERLVVDSFKLAPFLVS